MAPAFLAFLALLGHFARRLPFPRRPRLLFACLLSGLLLTRLLLACLLSGLLLTRLLLARLLRGLLLTRLLLARLLRGLLLRLLLLLLCPLLLLRLALP